MTSKQDGTGSPSEWLQLANIELLPALDLTDQIKCQIATNVRDLALPTATLERLNSAVSEAVDNAIQQHSDCASQPPIILYINLLMATRHVKKPEVSQRYAVSTPALGGWGFFLVERLVESVKLSMTASQPLIELYLYQEGELYGEA